MVIVVAIVISLVCSEAYVSKMVKVNDTDRDEDM